MGESTAIAWTDATFNPWWGCTKVSPACDHCYAETWAKRVGKPRWGAGEPRRYFGDKHWHQPVIWNARAEAAGVRRKVFCASMADVFDNEVDQAHRERLWALIRATPWLTWQLLTKRIGNALSMLPADFSAQTYPNAWIGMTVVTPLELDRDIGKLRAIPAAVRWLSVEPQLEHVDVPAGVQWVVTGGESGAKARPYDLAWARSVVRQCRVLGAAPFVKQLGRRPQEIACPQNVSVSERARWQADGWTEILENGRAHWRRYYRLNDRAGADPNEWPEDLRVQEFPAQSSI